MKKNFRTVLLAVTSLIGLAACNKITTPNDCINGYGSQTVHFDSNIRPLTTRAFDAKWEANDAIGIFMTNAGTSLATVVQLPATNKQYITVAGDGKFVPANEENKIVFPEADQKVDFVAYYPHTAGLESGNLYNINVSKQDPQNAIDLLYSDNLKSVSASTPKEQILFNFRHILSKLVFNVSMESGSIISGMSAKLKGFEPKAKFNLSNATLTNEEGVADFAAVVKGSTVEAIVVPNKTPIGTVEFFIGDKTYIWTPKQDLTSLESGKKYSFDIKLTQGGEAVTLNPGGTISDWEVVDGGEYNLTPEGEAGEPTITVEGETALSFSAQGETKKLSIKTDGKFDVKKSDNTSWITVTPMNGEGSQELNVTVSANETSQQRSASLTISTVATKSSTSKSVVITITQQGKGGSDPQQPEQVERFFSEGFTKLTKDSPQQINFREYKKYADHPELQYEFSYDSKTLRATKTLDGHVWFGKSYANHLEMKNIPLSGHKKKVVLRYQTAANGTDDTPLLLKVEVNGEKKTVKGATSFAKKDSYVNNSVEIGDLNGETVTLKFYVEKEALKNGLRLDNIELEGSK